MAALALLLPGALIIYSAPSASAATTYGRVTVSGTNILVNGAVPTQKFIGVVETTALQFAIMAYINGDMSVAGKTSQLNGPDTSGQGYIPYHATAEQFWHQYFALNAYYNCNLVRLGAGDQWGSGLQYEAWLNHHDAYISFLKTMCAQAEKNGVWICFVLAGSQEYPTYSYGGSGTVFDPSSSSFSRYVAYCRDTMAALEGQNAIAMYDLFNEPDHNNVANNYWQGDKVRFNTWENAVATATAGASTHPRTMGVAGLGNLFGWGQADFDLATGKGGFEILHRHYYASATGASNAYLFTDPENWAKQDGKPLYWGELAYNGVYPLTRYTFGEQTIWAAGGQAIAPMVLTGTSGYPYTGGLLPDQYTPPTPTPTPAELKFTSSPVATATVGSVYAYTPTTSISCTLTLSTDAGFLSTSSGLVSGTPDKAGSFSVRIAERSSDGRTIYQNYTLVVASAPTPPIPPVNGGDTTTGDNTTGGTTGGTGGNTAGNTTDGSTKSNPTISQPRNVWSWLSDWFKAVFGGGRSSTVTSPTATQNAPVSKSSGYVLGGGSDALLVIGALAASIALVGAYLMVSKKKK